MKETVQVSDGQQWDKKGGAAMLEDYPDVLTPHEVMEILGIGRNLLYQLMQEGTIPAFRLGKKMWRVLKKDLIGYVER